mgnify:CR=1 FL=1
MKRIDTINARENMFGAGKSGFHDNSDLPGQDATYVSPKWFNTVQEELCNILELRGIALDPEKNRQLYDLLTTQTDLEALADEIETNFIRKSQIVDNLTTNDANKPVSAKQAKVLQDNKLGKTENAVSATKLQTARKINGVNFDGSTDIDLPLIGVNQTWQNLTASRAAETIYTNTTGKPIQVAISYNGNNAYFDIGGVEIYMPDYNSFGFAFFIIPNGTTYRIRNQISINSWSELR